MKTRFLFVAAALATFGAVSVPAIAQAPIANPDPAAVQGGTYEVEPNHTRVTFSVWHFGFTQYFGEFVGAKGALALDPRNPAAARLDVTVPTTGVATTNAKLDEELKSADWFDAARFPIITFHSLKVTPTGTNTADVAGTITIHGVTRPLVLKARFNGAGVNPLDKAYTVGFNATGTIRRSDFGVTKYVPLVSDEVTLNLSAAFEKKAG